VRYALKEARLQNPVLTNRNGIQRLFERGKQAHLCNALDQQLSFGRCRSNWRKEYALTRGDLGLGSVLLCTKKSAEVIVAALQRAPIKSERTHR